MLESAPVQQHPAVAARDAMPHLGYRAWQRYQDAAQTAVVLRGIAADVDVVSVPVDADDLDEIEVARRYLAALEAKRRLQIKLADLAPAAASWEVLASGRGDFSVGDAAKILSRDPSIEIGQNRLFASLADLGWTYRQRGDHGWRVYQSSITAGRLSEIPQSHSHPRTGRRVIDPPQIRVTAKGLAELRERLGGGRTEVLVELPRRVPGEALAEIEAARE
jgi:phage antirepressor YoqD-like protein